MALLNWEEQLEVEGNAAWDYPTELTNYRHQRGMEGISSVMATVLSREGMTDADLKEAVRLFVGHLHGGRDLRLEKVPEYTSVRDRLDDPLFVAKAEAEDLERDYLEFQVLNDPRFIEDYR